MSDFDHFIAEGDAMIRQANQDKLDAALGRAVRAAAERDGPEREAMARAACSDAGLNPMRDDLGGRPWWRRFDGQAQAAARALIAIQEGR